MNLKQLWQKYLNWVFILWSIYAIFAHPGWLVFVAGLILWVLVVYLTAPGIFWTYVYLLPFGNNFDVAKTIRKLERAVDKKPLIAMPYASLGILYARNNRWQEAIPQLEAAIRLGKKKDQVEYKTILAVALRETADYENAYRLLDELVAHGVKTMKVYYNYAACYLRQNRLTEALDAAQRARSLNTTAPEPVLLLARIYFTQHDYQAAKDNYEWAIANTNWPVESYYWLGRCQLEQGEVAEALPNLEKAVQRIVDDPNLSDVTEAEAREWLEKARALAPVADSQLEQKQEPVE